MAKFKVGDRVKYVGGTYKSITGKVGTITHDHHPNYGAKVGGHNWFLSDDELEPEAIAVPLSSDRVTPKIEPVCPSCGCKDARNYFGVVPGSAMECANYKCKHYKELVNG